MGGCFRGCSVPAADDLCPTPSPRSHHQSFAIVRDYEAAQTLDAAAVRRAAAAPHRADAVHAARVLAYAIQPGGTEQLWHSGGLLRFGRRVCYLF